MSLAVRMSSFEPLVSQTMRVVGSAIEVVGVSVIVLGIVVSAYLCLHDRLVEQRYDAFRVRIGRTLLLGLEVLVAADIVKTIALELTVKSLGVLAGLILIRTFLSWAL